jgi:hypothetical protein
VPCSDPLPLPLQAVPQDTYSYNSFPTLNFRFGINARNIITGDVKNSSVKLAIESWLDLVSAVMIFFAAIIPAYLSLKLKGNIRKVTITLTAFIVMHGIYHVVRMQGIESIADSVFEPASIIVLIAFGLTYLSVSYKKEKQEATEK